ncbi:DUF72 domain-containing protein [Alteromonas lipolytica]|uniref:DUF72 domain-containing protein n=1 Tax=Alteromonas lipolytica TaxID=1856405 RepID=A0A1E8FKA8_9ALTE|nr:DUF72 domain-containing protein [Alteromonas lipolytica]OFI36048.1 hypothetical protein BFC17_10260 [Alteromonas lipolytica]GGF71378.1 hypothetical protein GCM10011338_24490 [Alteromonas lipolytica]
MTNIHSATTLAPVFIGLPLWQHNSWPKRWFGHAAKRQLADYSLQLNSVEGNTTFYHLPGESVVDNWAAITPADFRFTFKFHGDISHKASLRHCDAMVTQQLNLLARLEHKLGQLMLQLPASFGPAQLPLLEGFIQKLPADFSYGVEVRHPDFFAKGEAEKLLNRLLMAHGVNRVIMDTRALFTGDVDNTVTAEVRTKKPRVPVNVIATANQPVMRFVGNNNDEDNARCLQPWVAKCHQWREQGKTSYLFFHRPDNQDAPWLAQQFIELYNLRFPQSALPELTFAPAPATQNSLF